MATKKYLLLPLFIIPLVLTGWFSQVAAHEDDEDIEECVKKYVESGISEDEAHKRCDEIFGVKDRLDVKFDVKKLEHSDDIMFCAQDVRQCPDGSYVKRVPPKCEFEACPSGEKPKEVPVSDKPTDLKPLPKEILISRCDAILKEIEKLSGDLSQAADEKKEEISKEIQELKEKYEECKEDENRAQKEPVEVEIEDREIEVKVKPVNLLPVAVSITQGVCEKVKSLEGLIEVLDEQIEELKKLSEQGEDVAEKLKALIEEREFLHKRLEDAKKACEEGIKEEKERPCVKAAELEILYEKLKEQLSSAISEEDLQRIKKEMEDILAQIKDLKKKCNESDLETEIEIEQENGEKKIELSELDKAFDVKFKAAVEGASGEDISRILQEIEEEKDNAIRQVLSSVDVVDISGSDLIKEIKITPKSVSLEGIEAPVKKIKVKIERDTREEAEVEIGIEGKKVKIKEGNVEVETDTDLEIKDVDGDGLSDLVEPETGETIKVSPVAVREKVKLNLGDVEMEDIRLTDVKREGAVIYEVKAKKRGKLFGFLPFEIDIPHTVSVDASEGQIKDVQKPWWSFLFR